MMWRQAKRSTTLYRSMTLEKFLCGGRGTCKRS